MPVWEDVKAAFDEARPILADAFHSDDYEIKRMERVADGSGGWTNEEVVVESGKCALTASTIMGTEGASGPLTLSIASYEAEMPIDTDLTAADALYINERKFDVIAVRKGGEHELFVTAQVEEAS